MKIGDLVVRGYAWHCLDIGIVVDNVDMCELFSPECETLGIEEHIVQWGSGSLTKELPEELDYVDDVYEDLRVAFNL